MSGRKPAPQVTGISPKEGPPGTRVTIRGENLGIDSRDLIGLTICGVDCLLSAEWKSSNKIIARTGRAKGVGDIIVQTKTGGVGSATVQFRGFNVQIGPLQESAVWVDETQTFGAIISRGRQASPIVSQDLDEPLGICNETSDKKITEEELQEIFPEGSGNTNLDNFDPAWYLLENHNGTSFEDLKAGLANLRRKALQQNEGPFAHAKINLTTFLDCYEMLTEMHTKMASDKDKAHGLSATSSLQETLQKANKAAESVFDDVLGRKDRADATRNALSVLNRFKLLFYLPSTIEKNIQKGDYDLVITDYTRTKSLFWVTEVQAFKKVYNEVENRIAAFREMLYQKLMTMPSTLDEQKKLIRYLVHLEAKGDPAWECLVNMQKWLIALMTRCQQEHVQKEDDEEKELARTSSVTPVKKALRNTSFKSGGKPPQRVIFVELLTKLTCDNIPDFWRLGQSYLSGKLLKEVKKTGRADAAKQAQFKQMMQEIITLYANLIRSAFLPRTLLVGSKQSSAASHSPWREPKQDLHLPWLPVCVRQVRSSIALLVVLELPSESTDILYSLAFDLRWNSLITLLRQAVNDTKNLYERETWTIDRNDERGGTTTLPTLFENIVNEMVHALQDVVTVRQGEKLLFADANQRKVVTDLCTEIMQTFAATLERLALAGSVDKPVSMKKSTDVHDVFARLNAESSPSLRLIIVVNNCALTVDHILPRIVENLDKHGYPNISPVQQLAVKTYREVDSRLFSKYIDVKASPVIGALEQNMNIGMFDWATVYPLIGVRSYIKESIMSLLEVHTEVYSIGPTFVERVMCYIVEQVAEELCRLFQCVHQFCHSGAVQAHGKLPIAVSDVTLLSKLQAKLDLCAFDKAVGIYKTQKTRSALKDALGCVSSQCTPADNKLIDEHLEKFTKQMHFQLMCFQADQRKVLKPS